ncbi:zinc finger protein 862-like [Patiria miniata]|uniref:DUF4371 domain-containing protein n=1 Tax=Patiria miniata TaxID=46514 RepID=A0A914AP06_PATMI|nr:zinc finger protein 862-like [Patiria miniata]
MLKNEKLAEIKASPYFALLCDETTDVTVLEQLIVHITYLDCVERETKVTFLEINEIANCTSDVIKDKLVEVLRRTGLDFRSKMAGFGSDGASTMVGRINGVAAQLKRESSTIISNHCVAHRLALAVGGASGKVDYVKKFNNTLEILYHFYEKSSVRTAALKEIQDSLHVPSSRPKRPRTTRWLSHDQACDTLSKTLPAVMVSLRREGSERGDPKAIGLSLLVEDWRFVACFYMMLDILPQLSILSKSFQENSLDFEIIQKQVAMTVEILEARLVRPGPNFHKMQQGTVLEAVKQKIPDFTPNIKEGDLEKFKENYFFRMSKGVGILRLVATGRNLEALELFALFGAPLTLRNDECVEDCCGS